MTPLGYIRIDADILGLNLSSTEKLILGAVKNLNGRGLMLSNAELARLLNSKSDTVSKAIGRLESKELIHFDNRQSRYRRIYFGKKSEVETESTSDLIPSTSDLIPSTSEKNPTIIKETQGTKDLDLFGKEPKKEKTTPKSIFDLARKLYPGRKNGLDVEFTAFQKAVKDWRDIIPILVPSIRAYAAHCERLKATGQFCPGHKDFCRWLKKRCWATEYPDPMAGASREATETEAAELLQGTDDE